MNNVKELIQKEEYIALAINKYILQTGTIPKKNDNTIDWGKLSTSDYLGTNFNKKNPITQNDIVVTFDGKNNVIISGILEKESDYKSENSYLYNFYRNRLFRVNTMPQTNIQRGKIIIGSQVLYPSIQKDIIKLINENDANKRIKLATQECESGKYFYELRNKELTYKYCKSPTSSISVFQETPIYLEDWEDLQYIKANIGDKAYVKKNGAWYEYYYQGDCSIKWIPTGLGNELTSVDDGLTVEDRILSYIPDSKDLLLRRDGGCMLANGDIFCWGNNQYKKAGIESYGQLDKTLKPDYVNTPVMLKVQIDKITEGIVSYDIKSIKWYNNPYRVKFEKIALNSTNVCGISPIFNYFDGAQKKFGGDLYCNGQLSSTTFEDMETGKTESSILKRNKFFYTGKSDQIENGTEIYLKDIVMVEDATAVLSDTGKIYTFGKNYSGALGVGKSDLFYKQNTPAEVKNSGQIFIRIFALRDIRGFGAIDNNNMFYIWGERPNGTIITEPTLIAGGKQFNKDAIFVNSKDFILKGIDGIFYRTSGTNNIQALNSIPSSAISASIYDRNGVEEYLYINEFLELKGSSNLLSCRESNGSDCTSNHTNIFNTSLNELNTRSNIINGTSYANFSNVSIFQLDYNIFETKEDFESSVSGWIASNSSDNNKITSVTDNGDPTQTPATNFLGRFPIVNCITGVESCSGDPYEVSKTFSYPIHSNKEVEIEFDIYEIDSWDGERFEVYANNVLLARDNFVMNANSVISDSNITGENLQDNVGRNGTIYSDGDQKYKYKLKSKFDSSGNLTLKFRTSWETEAPYYNFYSNVWYVDEDKAYEDMDNESWGIDNVILKIKETNKTFVCAMTGFGSASQMYCWGDVARTIPILSTSLYDVSKIPTINKLFISQESEKTSQMSFNDFYYDGKLWLKFPTYIAGFDYPFYFK